MKGTPYTHVQEPSKHELPESNESTFVKLETIKSEELNYFVPEKWHYSI